MTALLIVSGVFLAAQVGLTSYGPGHQGAAVVWFAVGCMLLVLVDRVRSRVARGLVVVGALVGAVLFAIAAVENPSAVALVVTYLGQAVPLLLRPVREHVQQRP